MMALFTSATTSSLHQWSKQSLEHQEALGFFPSASRPPTFRVALRAEQNPKIPSPSLFLLDAAPEISSNSHAALPAVAECAVHLELLQVFQHLSNKILSSGELDQALGIELNRRVVFRNVSKFSKGYRRYERQETKLRDLTFDERRKTKWPLFLSLAAARFLKWVEVVEEHPAEPVILPPVGMLDRVQMPNPAKSE
jgi:hypothetical protein